MSPRVPLPPALTSRAFTAQEAANHGLGRRRLDGADLRSPARGIWVSADVELTADMLARAVLSRLPGAFACDLTAAAIWGAPLPQWCTAEPLNVARPSGRAPTGRGIRGRVLAVAPHEIVVRSGIRVSSPARTWLDLGSRLALRDLVAVGDHLLHHRSPVVLLGQLSDAVDQHPGSRGIRRLRAALPLLCDRSESRRETHLRLLLVRAGIGAIQVNYWITTSSGHRYRADFAVPGAKIAIEYQGEHHFDPVRQRADMVRRSRLQASGWIVIEVSKDDLANPRDLLARIRATLALR
ncbi:DUF559 domain-containing protein [Schumannella luteola]